MFGSYTLSSNLGLQMAGASKHFLDYFLQAALMHKEEEQSSRFILNQWLSSESE